MIEQVQSASSVDSNGVPIIPGISLRGGFRFRQGQELFLRKLAAAFERGDHNQLGVFVPGYGKTITALASFAVAYGLGLARKLVIFVPRGNLRDQYADPKELSRVFFKLGAPSFSFCVADSERVFLKNLDTSIIITTYQYASGKGGHRALLDYCRSAPCMFVFDEVHHLSDDGLWASKIQQFPFSCSVALSGTPMRSDNKSLFGVPVEVRGGNEQFYIALHEVTMRDAHSEGKILKRVKAHVIDYKLKMKHADTGETVELSLSKLAEIAKNKNDVDAFLARKKLRFHEVYLETLLRPAFDRFAEKRRALLEAIPENERTHSFRNHQLLVIAMSNLHAQAILEFVRARFPQFSSARIGQDVGADERQKLLDGYRNGRIDVMVQVDMIGEGTDIKPISVIVKADLVRAYSKTMQQVFRGMRYYDAFPAEANLCDIYAADDSEVVTTLEWITSEEQIGITLRETRDREESAMRGVSPESMWELTEVHHHEMLTHTLELFPEYARPEPVVLPAKLRAMPVDRQNEGDGHVMDVSRQELMLRQECASLAQRLAHILRAAGNPIEIAMIHAEAKKRLSKSQKAQEELSILELTKKQMWLERCISARRLV
jgi:superfamily II DNA or RNA helicase